jgi:hypothetical protein
MKRLLFSLSMIFCRVTLLWGEEAKEVIAVFPSTPFYQYIIYESLVIFWIAILGLLIIIRMKLKEIERTQKMGFVRGKDESPWASSKTTNGS